MSATQTEGTEMNTAQRIAATFNSPTFAAKQAAMTEARELSVKIEAANCIERTFFFYDGSKLTFTADAGLQVG
jgi:hypothetical protein